MLDEINSFVKWLRRRNPNSRTWRDYSYDLSQFVCAIGDRQPNSVTHHDVDHFINRQASRGLKPATINRHLAAITFLYTFLADDDPSLVCPILPHRTPCESPRISPVLSRKRRSTSSSPLSEIAGT